jgi:putative transposase
MSRRRFLPSSLDVYVVSNRAAVGRLLLERPEDRARFGAIYARHIGKARVRLLGYRVTSRAYAFVVKGELAAVSRFMRDAGAEFVRGVNTTRRQGGPLFAGRYKSRPVQSQRAFHEALAAVHLMSEGDGEMDQSDPEQHLESSYRHLLGQRCRAGESRLCEVLDVFGTLATFARSAATARLRFIEFSDQFRTEQTLLRASRSDAGSGSSARKLRDRIVAHFTCVVFGAHGARAGLKLVYSRSGSHRACLVRAASTWHCRTRGVATQEEMAAHFGRNPATLSHEIRGYRRRRPDLFRQDTLDLSRLKSLPPEDPPAADDAAAGDEAAC